MKEIDTFKWNKIFRKMERMRKINLFESYSIFFLFVFFYPFSTKTGSIAQTKKHCLCNRSKCDKSAILIHLNHYQIERLCQNSSSFKEYIIVRLDSKSKPVVGNQVTCQTNLIFNHHYSLNFICKGIPEMKEKGRKDSR